MSAPVSVVIPTFNNAEYIEQTLDSVFAQTYPNVDVIVADHESSDGTWEILQSYADRITVLRTEAGGGAGRNWNRVTDAANGEYVKLLCGDDLIYPTCIADQVAALEASTGAAMAASKRDIIDATGDVVVKDRGLAGLSGLGPGREAIRRSVRQGTNIFGEPGCVLFRREALVAAGGWDPAGEYLIDQRAYTAVLLRGDLVAVPKTLAAFRVNAAQWSVRLTRVQAQQAKQFHRELHAKHPDVVSRSDVRLGNVKATATAWARRGFYMYLGRRMGKAASSAVSC